MVRHHGLEPLQHNIHHGKFPSPLFFHDPTLGIDKNSLQILDLAALLQASKPPASASTFLSSYNSQKEEKTQLNETYIGFMHKGAQSVAQNSTYTTPTGLSHHYTTFDCKLGYILKSATLPHKACQEDMGFDHSPQISLLISQNICTIESSSKNHEI
jgi:hypothetical protein